MSNILFIGEYFPKFSWGSLRNHMIGDTFKNAGHTVFLVSDSWCEVKENDFSNVLFINNYESPFYKTYFVDPDQLRGSFMKNSLLGLLGLSYKLCENETIDKIYISNLYPYSIVGSMLKKNYKIDLILGQFSNEQHYLFRDTYFEEILKHDLNSFDRVFANKEYEGLYINLDKDINYFDSIPFPICCSSDDYSFNSDTIYIIGEISINDDIKYIGDYIQSYAKNKKINILLFGDKADELKFNLKNTNINLIDIELGIDFVFNIPKNSVVSEIHNFVGINSYDINNVLTLYKYGFLPIVNNYLANYLKKYYNAYFIHLDENINVLKNINIIMKEQL